MSYEVDDWFMSFDSSDDTGNSKLLVVQDIYVENDGIKVEYNFSNAGCGAVNFELNLGGESRGMSSASNNYDGSLTFTDFQLLEDEYTLTANVTGAADCDDDIVLLYDQYEVVVVETDSGGSGGDGDVDDELTLSDLDYDCDISRSSVTEGESVVVDVSIDGFAPSGTGPWTVPIDVVADGRVVAQGSGSVSVNGSSGESFDVEFYDTGTYNIEVDLYQPYE